MAQQKQNWKWISNASRKLKLIKVCWNIFLLGWRERSKLPLLMFRFPCRRRDSADTSCRRAPAGRARPRWAFRCRAAKMRTRTERWTAARLHVSPARLACKSHSSRNGPNVQDHLKTIYFFKHLIENVMKFITTSFYC